MRFLILPLIISSLLVSPLMAASAPIPFSPPTDSSPHPFLIQAQTIHILLTGQPSSSPCFHLSEDLATLSTAEGLAIPVLTHIDQSLYTINTPSIVFDGIVTGDVLWPIRPTPMADRQAWPLPQCITEDGTVVTPDESYTRCIENARFQYENCMSIARSEAHACIRTATETLIGALAACGMALTMLPPIGQIFCTPIAGALAMLYECFDTWGEQIDSCTASLHRLQASCCSALAIRTIGGPS